MAHFNIKNMAQKRYLSDPRTLVKVGIGFDPDTHNMHKWRIEG